MIEGLLVVLGLVSWYGLGLLGSDIGFTKIFGDSRQGWKYEGGLGYGAALAGPINLVVTVFLVRD